MKLTVRLCKSARNARGDNEKNIIMATRKRECKGMFRKVFYS